MIALTKSVKLCIGSVREYTVVRALTDAKTTSCKSTFVFRVRYRVWWIFASAVLIEQKVYSIITVSLFKISVAKVDQAHVVVRSCMAQRDQDQETEEERGGESGSRHC